MSYTKTNWTNDSGAKINATNLNNIENGVYNNDIAIGDISELETTSTDLVGAINEVENRKPVLLWTNPNPNNSFSSSQITLSSDNYDFLEIYYYDWTTSKRMKSTKVLKGENILLNASFYTETEFYITTRGMTYNSDTSYTFSSCTALYGSGTMQIANPLNYTCVPVKIYGYKY